MSQGFQPPIPLPALGDGFSPPSTRMSTDVREVPPNGSMRGRGRGWGRSRGWGRGSRGAREDVVAMKSSEVITTIVYIGLGVDVTGVKSCCLLLSRASIALHASSQ